MNLYKQAMNGNAAAITQLTRLIEKLQVTQEALERANAEAAEQNAEKRAKQGQAWFEYLVELKDKQAKAWADAEAEGKDEPDDQWPHPHDILIQHAKRNAQVRGPLSVKELRYFAFLEAQRDLMFLRDMIHLKTSKLSAITGMSFWELMWRLLDERLPLRWQIAPRVGSFELANLNKPLRTLRRLADATSRRVDDLEPPQCKVRDRQTYKIVNSVMKPALAKLGYRSVAHFERVYKETEVNSP